MTDPTPTDHVPAAASIVHAVAEIDALLVASPPSAAATYAAALRGALAGTGQLASQAAKLIAALRAQGANLPDLTPEQLDAVLRHLATLRDSTTATVRALLGVTTH